MYKRRKRSRRPQEQAEQVATPTERTPQSEVEQVGGNPSQDIPPHVWTILQEAGEQAAQRLLDLIASPQFTRYTPSAQKQLIELALTRAYGLPVRKSLNVTLESSDSDAIAASLMGLHDALPERRAAPRDVTPDSETDDDT